MFLNSKFSYEIAGLRRRYILYSNSSVLNDNNYTVHTTECRGRPDFSILSLCV